MNSNVRSKEVDTALKTIVKDEWVSEVFWTPVDVANFLTTLTPSQASAAKVGQYEVKIMVLYPRQTDTLLGS